MFKCNRIIGTAVGLIFTCNFVSIKAEGIATNQTQSSDKTARALVQNPPEYQAECNQETADRGQKVGQWDGAAFTLNCNGNVATSEEDQKASTQRERENLVAQQSVAESTKTIVGFTFLQIILSAIGLWALLISLRQTGRAVKAAEKQSIISEKTAEHQLRAYIGVIECRANRSSDGAPISFTFKLQNFGQTPAFNISGCTEILEIKSTIDELSKDQPIYHDIAGVIEPTNSINIIPKSDILFDARARDGIAKNKFSVAIFGYFRYFDFTGKERNLRFTRIWHPEKIDDNALIIVNNGEYSD